MLHHVNGEVQGDPTPGSAGSRSNNSTCACFPSAAQLWFLLMDCALTGCLYMPHRFLGSEGKSLAFPNVVTKAKPLATVRSCMKSDQVRKDTDCPPLDCAPTPKLFIQAQAPQDDHMEIGLWGVH